MGAERKQYHSTDLIRGLIQAPEISLQSLFSSLDEKQRLHFVNLAIQHGLASLLYNGLRKEEAEDLIYPDSLQYLKKLALLTAAANEKLLNSMDQTKQLTTEVVFLKGIALLPMLYGDISLRTMSDLDLITSAENFPELIKKLRKEGYKENRIREGKVSTEGGSSYPEGWTTMKKGAVVIDLHYKIFFAQNRKFIEGKSFIDHSQIYLFGDRSFRCPTPALMLIHLILHLDKHLQKGITRYSNLVDILLFLKKYGKDLDWKELDIICYESDSSVLVYSWLNLLCEEYDLQLNYSGFEEKASTLLAKRYKLWMADGLKEMKPLVLPWKRSVYKELDSPAKKFRYILSVIFPSITYMRTYYGLKSNIALILFYPWRILKHVLPYFRRSA